ncbi:MAG: SIMPL domain-containing protein [Oscillospiraceae bacterium]|nr:SIMPL domain-containing protein [Oscillospiraceae bacterium]
MTKFNVRGSAEQEFEAEIFEIQLTLRTEDKNAGESIAKGAKTAEQLLQMFSDKLHIEPEQIRMEADSVSRGYQDEGYNRTLRVSLHIPADLAMLHAVTGILESVGNAEYHLEYLLADPKAAEETVMRAAFADSRAKADKLAEMLGVKVTGADHVNYEYSGEEEPAMYKCAGLADVCSNALADRLQKPVIRIQKSVNITWLAE